MRLRNNKIMIADKNNEIEVRKVPSPLLNSENKIVSIEDFSEETNTCDNYYFEQE